MPLPFLSSGTIVSYRDRQIARDQVACAPAWPVWPVPRQGCSGLTVTPTAQSMGAAEPAKSP
jgi:hypothetical protein